MDFDIAEQKYGFIAQCNRYPDKCMSVTMPTKKFTTDIWQNLSGNDLKLSDTRPLDIVLMKKNIETFSISLSFPFHQR